jgi:hypothetical protein
MSFTTTDPGGKNSKQGQEVLRSQLGILKKFIEGFDFVRMKPDSTVVEGVAAQGLSVDVLAETGVAYAIYLRKSDIKDLNPVLGELGFKLPSGNYKVEWLNPVSGNVDMEITFAHSGGEKKLNSPLFNTDVALAIRRIDGN